MRRRRAPTEAERVLWQSVIRDVRPLDPAVQLPAPLSEPAPAPPAEITAPPPPPTKDQVKRPGTVDRPTLDRLKRGRVEVEARIDLHGMDQRAAFAALLGFVDMSVRTGRRAILVITGKGAVSQGGGVLRRNAPQWLMSSPLASKILAIAPAHVRHGGEGAFYVLLRRTRSRSEPTP